MKIFWISTVIFSLGAQLFVEIDFRGVDLRITVWQANEVKCFSVTLVVGVHWVDGFLWWVELLSL